jgi:homospermidine synthase
MTATFAAISGTGVKCLSKAQMREHIRINNHEVSETTFRKLTRLWKLWSIAGISQEEFKKRKLFWGEEAERLSKHLEMESLNGNGVTPSV